MYVHTLARRCDTDTPLARQSLRIKGLELEHFLLEPMQRLARYALLISQVSTSTLPHVPHC